MRTSARSATAIAFCLGVGLCGCAPSPSPAPEGEPAPEVGRTSAALGEPRDGFPSWDERVIHVWSNRARSDPAADLAGCTQCAERACYSPRPPLVWDHNLSRGARFHSANLWRSGCSLQHDSPCTLVSDISTRYTPGSCNGDPSCACMSGTLRCGSVGTPWNSRIAMFGTSPSAENIAGGFGDPIAVFYAWLWESDSNSACGWRSSNGHRANILGTSSRLGVGCDRNCTQDFAGGGTPSGIVQGVHTPRMGTSFEMRANWYGTAGPSMARVDVDGTCTAMTLERGTAANGTYLASVTLASGCHNYYFHFTTGAGDVTYPSTGSFGIGCTSDWSMTRPTACGAVCSPMCSGRECGADGCGGSCGTCSGGRTCDASGRCACASGLMWCGTACTSTASDPANCGTCGHACAATETCNAGTCMRSCTPSCGGRECGDDGCSGSCGTCSAGLTCDGAGRCSCPSGLTYCASTCVDTQTDESHCGGCDTPCAPSGVCVASACTMTCTPSCGGRTCGADGCGGSCGACAGGLVCNAAGACECPAGLTDCGGTCVDTTSDESSCGACGVTCAAPALCIGGSCGGVPIDAGTGVDAARPELPEGGAVVLDGFTPVGGDSSTPAGLDQSALKGYFACGCSAPGASKHRAAGATAAGAALALAAIFRRRRRK